MYYNNAFLTNKTALDLYENIKDIKIFDFHNHISAKEIYENKIYANIVEIWLKNDHYKWRLMRNYGIAENFITGDASCYEKFLSYATVISNALGNPLYHWTHMELEKYFNILTPLDKDSAKDIYLQANKVIKDIELSPRKLLKMSNVAFLGTTDDPCDDLYYHKTLAKENYDILVCPTFRPDNVLLLKNGYFNKLGEKTGLNIDGIDALENALIDRLEFFIKNDCRASDYGIPYFPTAIGDREDANRVIKKHLNNEIITYDEYNKYLGYMMLFLARLYRKNEIVMQLHLAVIRNVNARLFEQSGVDCGNDSIGDSIHIDLIAKLFNEIEQSVKMPKTICYTLNPQMYESLISLLGDFSDESKGKIQLGSAWWFNDHRDGILKQLKTFANMGVLGTFVGMLTDSRSFLSFSRHDYFRRILCSLIGEWIENGELQLNENVLTILKNICYNNSNEFFNRR